jgi:drug/metabolite transporter (DMT)-like permease
MRRAMATLLGSGELWATAAALFWAIAVILFRRAGEQASPLSLNLFKDVVALASFAPLLLATIGTEWPSWSVRDMALIAASGVLGITISDTLFFAALNRLGAGLNAVVGCLYFPSFVLQAYLFLGQRVTPLAVLGAAMVVVGILVGSAAGPEAGTPRRDIVVGILLGAVGVIIVGTGVVLIDDILERSPILMTTTVRLAAGTVALLPLMAVRPERAELGRLFRPSAWWRVAVPAAVSGGTLAMWAWLKGFSLADSYATIAILNQLSTFFVFLLAGWFLHEPLSARRWLAIALAFSGVTLVLVGR